jgi:UrcA family protein
MKTRQYWRGVMLLSGAALLAAGATAMADDAVTVRETVQYVPSQAQSSDGAQQLYDRLEHAAARVCRVPGRGLEGASYQACTSNALARAVKDVDIEAVAAIYLEKNKVADREGKVTVAKR